MNRNGVQFRLDPYVHVHLPHIRGKQVLNHDGVTPAQTVDVDLFDLAHVNRERHQVGPFEEGSRLVPCLGPQHKAVACRSTIDDQYIHSLVALDDIRVVTVVPDEAVRAITSEQVIVARAAGDGVVALVAIDGVVATQAQDGVVPGTAVDQVGQGRARDAVVARAAVDGRILHAGHIDRVVAVARVDHLAIAGQVQVEVDAVVTRQGCDRDFDQVRARGDRPRVDGDRVRCRRHDIIGGRADDFQDVVRKRAAADDRQRAVAAQ